MVAPAAGGLPDLVVDGVNGRLYQPGSPSGLRAAVTELIDNTYLRRAMAEVSRSTVAGRSWEAVAEEYLRHCREVLSETERSLSA